MEEDGMSDIIISSPTLKDLIVEWLREDPTLNAHFFYTNWKEGTYIETLCNHSERVAKHRYSGGYSLALFPSQNDQDQRTLVYYHGIAELGKLERDAKLRGYLTPEDPQYFQKLREFLILGHDGLFDVTNCKIKWEFGETLTDREQAHRQPWWMRDLPNL